MESVYNYIESYFKSELDQQERAAFEKRCETDEAFAGEVAFYIASRQNVREALLINKQEAWTTLDRLAPRIKIEEIPVRKIWSSTVFKIAAAASVIAIVALFFLSRGESPQKFAANYFNENYNTLSLSMGASDDSLEMAKSLYNDQDYEEANAILKKLYIGHQDDVEAIKYYGIVSMRLKNYDEAAAAFDKLSTLQLYNNPGNFLHALALLLRDNGSDKEAARRLLEQVVKDKTEGAETAAQLLKSW